MRVLIWQVVHSKISDVQLAKIVAIKDLELTKRVKKLLKKQRKQQKKLDKRAEKEGAPPSADNV